MNTRMSQIFILLIVFILAGCAPAQASATLTSLPSPSATILPSPTHTEPPVPTYTPFPTLTATATIKPTKIATPMPTINAAVYLTLMDAAEWYFKRGDYEMYIALQKELTSYDYTQEQINRNYMLIADAYEKLGDFENAIQYYLKAYEIDPATEGAANQICWDYGLLGKAETALPYCEQAVSASLTSAERDSRGLVNALLGKFDTAAEDFQAVVDELKTSTKAEEKEIYATRLAWIETLKAGENPITEDVLVELHRGATSDIALPTQTADEREAPLAILDVKKAAEEQGFKQFEPMADFEIPSTIGYYVEGSCNAGLLLSDPDQPLVMISLTLIGCSDDEQQGLAFWLVDVVYSNKSDKAKAYVWSFNDLYYVIDGVKTKTETATIGGFKMIAEFNASDKVLNMMIVGK